MELDIREIGEDNLVEGILISSIQRRSFSISSQ